MNALIATWPRRLFLALLVLLLAAALSLAWLYATHPDPLPEDDLMKRLVALPALLVTGAFLLFGGLAASAVSSPAEAATAEPAAPPAPFVAQVVGLRWLNPLHRMDYPTQWQLLWTLGLVQPNKNDDMVRTNPRKYSTLQAVASIAVSAGGKETFPGYYEKYVEEAFRPLGETYVMNNQYFYTVAGKNRSRWRELAGIHVEMAVPMRLDPVEAEVFLRKEIKSQFAIGEPYGKTLWSRDTPPDVRITSGGTNAGFTSLNAALDYLQAHPQESVWVMNWDAPSYPPKDRQINENIVWLILAGPQMKTERKPLAWIGRAAVGDSEAQPAQQGTTRHVAAWKAAIATAASNAGKAPTDIAYVIHDVGTGSDGASARLAPLARALTETLPEFDYTKQTFNTAGLLGDMGTGSALTNVALAIGRAHHLGGSVLVAGSTDKRHPTAVVVAPPAELTPIDPDKDWFRARGGNKAYLPWWGLRTDLDAQDKRLFGLYQGESW